MSLSIYAIGDDTLNTKIYFRYINDKGDDVMITQKSKL